VYLTECIWRKNLQAIFGTSSSYFRLIVLPVFGEPAGRFPEAFFTAFWMTKKLAQVYACSCLQAVTVENDGH
jgi:hypothetical protein